jgi:hypothetical protein
MRTSMPVHERHGDAPDLRLATGDGAARVPLRWRAFGAPGDFDLDLDLRQASRPAVVTTVLARCCVAAEHEDAAIVDDVRRLTLSGRIGGLAAIVARTSANAEIALELRCPAGPCGEVLGVALSLAQVLELGRLAEEERTISVTLPESGSLRVRRPTGEDQHGWQRQVYQDAASAERAMARSLLIDADASQLSDASLAAIDAALEDADPLPCFRVTVSCPACGHESELAVDLEAVLLMQLQRLQRARLRDVHRLAARYGWSEQAILAMPAWRRRVYLDWIEQEAS